MVRLSVIIPAYNKAGQLKRCLGEVERALEKIGLSYEIIVVDDGSVDGTKKEAEEFADGRDNVKVAGYEKNKGKGHALIEGFKFASGDLVAFLDADLDLHPSQLAVFIERMNEHGADVVIGSKNHPDSKVDYPFSRKLLSKSYQLINHGLFNLSVSDTQVGMKLFKRKVLETVLPKIVVKRFAFDLELLVVANKYGYKIIEAPVSLEYKNFNSTVSSNQIGRIFLDTIAIFYRKNIKKQYG